MVQFIRALIQFRCSAVRNVRARVSHVTFVLVKISAVKMAMLPFQGNRLPSGFPNSYDDDMANARAADFKRLKGDVTIAAV